MRLIQEIPHEKYKISVFAWNNKYIIKFDNGQLEQTYKISEWDLTGEEDIAFLVKQLITDKIGDVFDKMNQKLVKAIESL